jgi:ribosomal protein L3
MTKQIKGVLGTKLGMTQVFADDGKIVPVTVVAAGPCVVTAVRTPDADGYAAVQLGYGEIDPRKVNKPAGRPLREGRGDAAPVPGRAAHRQRIRLHPGPGSQRRDVRGRASWST